MSFTSAKGSSKGRSFGKTRGGVPLDAAPLVQGWLARESGVVDKLLNRRYGALYPSVFVTYRKEGDETPSKEWPISRDVQVSEVRSNAKFHLRHAKTSTLYAVVAGAYRTLEMHAFTVTWPHGADLVGSDRLTLAFEAREEAETWRAAFGQAIGRAEAGLRSLSTASEHSTGSAAPSTPPSPSLRAEGAGALLASGPAAAPQRPPSGAEARWRSWASVLHINGIAVYVEETDAEGDGGAVMVSAVVRSNLDAVFKNLVQQRKTEGSGVFTGAKLVEVIDSHTHVVSQRWKPSGVVGSFCAPREMVLLRTWRQDEDGTYIVLYQSTHHRATREAGRSGWFTPVRAQVQAAGFTIAPLMPKYTGGGESRECLVTLVLKADLGGALSGDSTLGRLMGPLSGYAVRAVLEPIVTSIVILRDKVEQDRFVVRPLSMGRGEELEEEATGADYSERRQRRMQRTATMLAYRHEPLAAAQQAAAEGAAQGVAATPVTAERLAPTGLPAAAAAPAPAAAAAAAEEDVGDAWAIDGTCDRRFWMSPGSGGFKVRGPDYLLDKKKVLAAPPMFELVAVDLLELEEPMFHICERLPSIRRSPAPFIFAVQLMVPSTPPISLVASWAAPMPVMGLDAAALIAQFEQQQGPCPDSVQAFFKTFTEFLAGDGPEADKLRNSKFKLIPNISKGSWVIKTAVGTTPVLLGSKLTTKYFRGVNYFEVDVDIGSSSVAASVTNLVAGATKSLAVDMGVLVEGKSSEQLPEQLIGTIRLDKLDLKTASYLDEVTGRILRPGEINGTA